MSDEEYSEEIQKAIAKIRAVESPDTFRYDKKKKVTKKKYIDDTRDSALYFVQSGYTAKGQPFNSMEHEDNYIAKAVSNAYIRWHDTNGDADVGLYPQRKIDFGNDEPEDI